MAIHEIMTNALRADWCITDDFSIYIFNKYLEIDGIQGFTAQQILDMCVKSVDTPQISSDVTPTLVAGTWRIHSAKFQVFTFSVVFRDLAGLRLKERFTEVWHLQQREYFDDIKSEVELKVNHHVVFASDNLLISSVSQSQFDNANSQASEFTVEFVSPTFTNNTLNNFGLNGAWTE